MEDVTHILQALAAGDRQAADARGLSVRSAHDLWTYARSWLRHPLGSA